MSSQRQRNDPWKRPRRTRALTRRTRHWGRPVRNARRSSSKQPRRQVPREVVQLFFVRSCRSFARWWKRIWKTVLVRDLNALRPCWNEWVMARSFKRNVRRANAMCWAMSKAWNRPNRRSTIQRHTHGVANCRSIGRRSRANSRDTLRGRSGNLVPMPRPTSSMPPNGRSPKSSQPTTGRTASQSHRKSYRGCQVCGLSKSSLRKCHLRQRLPNTRTIRTTS
mmetsp:Transcript_28246/g.45431  ORF Transcript_28246/g.45431 Transcript_28246/m.45431 type:complete len:222 (+) Transcript_28246:1387-2052(+)